jgi:hypothetical protein
MQKTVYMVNLGCPKNLVDGEVMLGLLARDGYAITLDPDQAEVLMVNTCSFINEAKEDRSIRFWSWRAINKTTQRNSSLSLDVWLALAKTSASPCRVDVFVGYRRICPRHRDSQQKRSLLDGQ